ncbi:GDSL esterase/lipase At5g45670-like [Vicia villosa]|uniref:GDSL esterase/lipase At5g45670-like n=1 Tax=Vicia villosa TaxID=3911 RepID=UPI00273B88AC|nr:GDSL esterase/lipase At5g45670-like [Vicia villosa]
MASELKTWLVLLLVLFVACYMQHYVYGNSPQVPCLFIFGDDFSDNGNNNNLPTKAKANYKPYGIDFPKGPTGRTTNGETTVDIVAKLLGFDKPIPPFANTIGSDILQGVNYASISAGIRNETGKRTAGTNIALGQQIENHKTIVAQIAKKLGGVKHATQYLKKCLYYFNIGTNDYSLNYFQPKLYSTSHTYNPEEYAQVLFDELFVYGEVLYNLGARKYVAVGLGKIGCTPMVLATSHVKGSCDENLNDIVAIFNHKYRSLTVQFSAKFPDAQSTFINTTTIRLDGSDGFKVFSASCCPMKSDGYCVPNSKPCLNRNQHVFYDGIHPTSAANKIFASVSYDSAKNPEITSPIDIKHLAKLVLKSN